MEKEKIIINAENGSYGRVSSFAAKQALSGKEIVVVNSEKAVITGNKKNIIEKYKALRAKGGHSQKGPRYSKLTIRMMKYGIRGMLPDHRRGIGKEAFSNIKCYDGIPEKFKDKEMVNFKSTSKKFISIKELSEKL